MLKTIQQRLQQVAIGTKTRILLWFIVIIFVFCWITGFLALTGLKADYDDNYPTQNADLLHISQIQNMSPDFQKTQILWEKYKQSLEKIPQHHKITTQIRLWYQVYFMQEQTKQIAEILEQRTLLIQKIDDTLYKQNSIDTQLLPQLVRINTILASINKNISDSIYSFSLKLFGFFIFLLACMFLILSKIITDSINISYNSLENLVAQKTIELQTLNTNLQKSIEYEVKQNQQKDLFLYQQARLASMGEMIHNIAHQWRQPLNSLTMLIQSFKTKYDQNKLDKNFIYEQTEYGLKIAKNMSETIESFSTFFRPDKEKIFFSISKALNDSLELLQGVLHDESIQVRIKSQKDYEILGYENAFTQVVFVLLNNAIDAFKEHQRAKDSRFVQISIKNIKENIYICVKDNAGGINLDDIQKIFEPYFTTKHKSVGTGIGLYMAKQIIEKQFLGTIEVQNITTKDLELFSQKTDTNFKGTLFSIIIPHKKR